MLEEINMIYKREEAFRIKGNLYYKWEYTEDHRNKELK